MWTHDLNPIALALGPLEIRWYGIMYVLAFFWTWFYLRWQAKAGKISLTNEDIETLMTYIVLGVIIGGRLGAVLFYYPGYYLVHPLEILMVWKGGLSFHGGVIAVLGAVYWFAHKRKISFLRLCDIVIVPLAFSQALGRIGNFINGELFGTITSVPWAMIFPLAGDLLPRHPSQLYEVAYNLVIGCVIFFLRDTKKKDGWLFGLWLILYAVARFLVEYVREPEVIVGPITLAQLLSVPMIIGGIYLMMRKAKDV